MNLSWTLDLYGFKYASLVTVSEVRIHIQDEIQHQILTQWDYVPRPRKLDIRKKHKGKRTENNPESPAASGPSRRLFWVNGNVFRRRTKAWAS